MHSYKKTVQFGVGHRTAAVSMKQTSVVAADYCSTVNNNYHTKCMQTFMCEHADNIWLIIFFQCSEKYWH